MRHFYRFFTGLMAVLLCSSAYAACPNAPSGLSLRFNAATGTISGVVTAPTTADYTGDYAPLEYLTSVVVERAIEPEDYFQQPDYSISAIFENPAPGEVLEFTDCLDVEPGTRYVYKATATVDGESSSDYACRKTMFAGILPDDIRNLSGSSDKGKSPVTLSFELPSVDIFEDPLDVAITAVTIKRNENFGEIETIATVTEGLEKGKVITYVDETAETGHEYFYFISAATIYGNGSDATIKVKVDLDVPGEIEEVKAELVGESVVLTWTAPGKGASNGYIDPEQTVYKIQRIIDGGENVELATDYKGTSFTDDRSELTEETRYTYRVTPSNEQGANTYTQIRDVIAGPPAAYPYFEDFNGGVTWNKAPEHNWQAGADKSRSTWGVSTYGYYGPNYSSVSGANPEVTSDGYAWTQYTPYTDADLREWYMTGRISMKEAQTPSLSFYVIGLPVESTTTLDAEIIDANGKTTLLETIPIQAEEYGWVMHSYDLSDWSGCDWIRLRFTSAPGEKPAPAGFDMVKISDEPIGQITQFVADGVLYFVKDAAASEVSVVGYPGDDVNAVIPEKVSYKDVEYTVTEIADQAFYNMPSLASVKIPSTVRRIGSMAFWGAKELTSIVIPEGVTSMGEGVFLYCDYLETVELPSTLESMDVAVFSYCRSLREISIPASMTEIPRNAFSFCVSLESVDLPETLTSIGSQAFSCAMALKNVSIPESVTYIGSLAFEETSLESVTIPAGVKELYSYTFKDCSALCDVTFLSDVPPTVAESAFLGIANPCIGHCPAGTENLYQNTPGLENIIFGVSAIDTIGATSERNESFYDLTGQPVDPSNYKGTLIRISRNGSDVKVTKIIR